MTNSETLITSCGIIKNRSVPRCGIISIHSLDPYFLDEIVVDGIDLGYQQSQEETRDQIREENPELSDEEIEEAVNESMSNVCENISSYIFGDWKKNTEGLYEIDQNGKQGFALSYSPESGVVTVEFSKHTKKCGHTSPCYVMANGDGPCGDLDSEGDSVVAFCLPEDCLCKEEGRE
jgi:hypothetical protein